MKSGLVRYDLLPGNEAGPILQLPGPTCAQWKEMYYHAVAAAAADFSIKSTTMHWLNVRILQRTTSHLPSTSVE